MVEVVTATKSDNIIYLILTFRNFREDLGFTQYIGWCFESILIKWREQISVAHQ